MHEIATTTLESAKTHVVAMQSGWWGDTLILWPANTIVYDCLAGHTQANRTDHTHETQTPRRRHRDSRSLYAKYAIFIRRRSMRKRLIEIY